VKPALSNRGIALVVALCVTTGLPGLSSAVGGPPDRPQRTTLAAVQSGSKAKGTVKSRSKRGVRISVLKMKRLDRRRDVTVFDDSTGEEVGRVRTNRRGRARLRLREEVSATGTLTKLTALSVNKADGGSLLLIAPEAEGPLTARSSSLSFIPTGDDFSTWTAWASLHAFEDGQGELMRLEVSPPDDLFPSPKDTRVRFGFTASSLDANLPFGASTIADIGNRAYRIRDGQGGIVAESRLPPVLPRPPLRPAQVSRAWLRQTASAMDEHPFSDMILEMEDDSGAFHEVATLKRFVKSIR